MNLNLLLRTKRTKIEHSEAFPIQSLFGSFMLSSGGRTKDPVRKTHFGILSTTLVLKFNLSTEFFLQVERTFLVRRIHQKLRATVRSGNS